MILTLHQVEIACGARIDRAQAFLPHLQETVDAYAIDTPARVAAFLSEIGHETLGLKYTQELWGPTATQIGYEGRGDLGNTQPGDGSRFRGHGLLQTTGRFNHARVRDRLRARFPHLAIPDFEEKPEALAEYRWAALSAGDFWDEHHCNAYVDAGDFDGLCDVINRGHKTRAVGDANGYPDRLARFERAQQVFA